MAWTDWFDDVAGWLGDAWDWFDDSDTAQDILGAILQGTLYDNPELDYDKLMEMAIKQATIDSPNQYTPTMTSEWTVDPETGERTQNLQYRPEFQSLLNMLVQRAGSPKDTYRAPTGMTEGLLGSRMNHLLAQSGQDPVNHQRFQFPEYPYADFSGMFQPSTPNTPNTPTPQGPRAPNVNPNEPGDEDTVVGGGYEQIGDGFNQNGDGFAGQFDPSFDQRGVVDDLVNRGPNANDFGSGTAPDQGFLDWLDNNIGPNWRNGTPFESWVIENSDSLGKWAGRIIGAAADIPGGGQIGQWIAGQLEELYFQAHPNLALSNPADIPPGGMDELINALNQITNQTAGVDGTEQSSPIPPPVAPRPPVGQGNTYGPTAVGTGTWSGVSPSGGTYGGAGGLVTYNRGAALRKKAKEWAEIK